MSIKNHYYSIVSGLCGSLASTFGKLMNYNFLKTNNSNVDEVMLYVLFLLCVVHVAWITKFSNIFMHRNFKD